MRRLAAIARWELRLQWRSLRSKAAVALYLALSTAAPAYLMSRVESPSPAAFLQEMVEVLPFLTLVMTALLAGHRSGAAAWPETWPVLASAPLSNAGYLLGRWLAVTALALPVSALPLLVGAGLATAAGGEWHAAGVWSWVGVWTLRIAPLVVIASAAWLGTVTILGGELAALAAIVVGLGLAVTAVNQALFRFRLRIETSPTLGAFGDFMRWTRRLSGERRDEEFRFEASEAPFDTRAVLEWLWPQMLLGAALAALALALAAAYVRRTRRDTKPRKVRPDHPLRTYLLALLRLREHLTPSAAPGRSDRLVMACGAIVLVGGLAWNVERQRHNQGLAMERYEVEVGDPIAPLAGGLKPETWKIHGEIEPSGALALEIRTSLRHHGAEPETHLAFSLNEKMETAAVEVPGRRVVVSKRAWDRVGLAVEPPLEPGETVEVRWRLRGVPGETSFPLWGRRGDPFVTRVDRFQNALFPRELSDLSRTRTFRAASPNRVELEAVHLAPVPRYTPWTLEAVRRGDTVRPEVPEEVVLPEAELEIELAAPPGVFLADSCGQTSRQEGGRSVLRGRCRTTLAEYTIFGGPHVVEERDGLVFATLEPHRHLVDGYGESLARTARLSHKAWPGLPGFEGLVVVEWFPHFERLDRGSWDWGGYRLRGRLLLVLEGGLVYGYLPGGEGLVADLMTRDLTARRAVAPEQDLFFRRMLAALMLQRMGIARQTDATVSGPPTLEQVLKTPLLEANAYHWTLWRKRLPAVLVDLENRLGSKTLFEGIEELLSRPGDEAGTVEELLEILERRGNVSLDRFYSDFLAGGAVPKLRLEEVESRREGRGFRVTGRVRNLGTGEVRCPVLVKTETGMAPARVTVDSESSAAFDVTTESRPHTVELDPAGTCHRLVTPTRKAAEHVDLLE